MVCYSKACLGELVEPGALEETRLRQAANDKYFKALTFKQLGCQPEPVEGGFTRIIRVRQAHPDTLIYSNFCHL